MFGGIIIRGEGVGRQLGYPTANLDVDPKKIKLRDGVYAARATVRNQIYQAALVIQRKKRKVEVYLLDWSGDNLYGLYLEVEPIQKVSEIEARAGDELKEKIAHDIILVKEVFIDP